MTRALVGLVGDTDLGGDPPAAGAGGPIRRTKLDAGSWLHAAVFAECHRPAHDLAVDQLDARFRASQQIGDGLQLAGCHRISPRAALVPSAESLASWGWTCRRRHRNACSGSGGIFAAPRECRTSER